MHSPVSLIKILNSKGQRTDPCSTPDVAKYSADLKTVYIQQEHTVDSFESMKGTVL